MKILLVGEYSGVHTNLSSGLKELGHDVVTLSSGDAYKKFPADVLIKPVHFKIKLNRMVYALLYFLGLTGLSKYVIFRLHNKQLDKFDIVQIINPVAIPEFGAIGNIFLLHYLKRNSRKFYMCALGDDFKWVVACMKGRYKYSPLDNMFRSGFVAFLKYSYSLKYVISPLFILLDFYARKLAVGIIPGLLDYQIAYEDTKKTKPMIPLPVGDENFLKPQSGEGKIKIFHGWQVGKERKKGNDLLDAAIRNVIDKYPERVEYYVASGMAYKDYVKAYSDCDIYIDQVYSYDRGMSGALGMCAGKVVFSGFEADSILGLSADNAPKELKNIGINAIPDVDSLTQSLCFLLTHPKSLYDIKIAAYEFARGTYAKKLVAQKYVDCWVG